MSMITISVQSLLNAALYDPYTLDDSSVLSELKAVIELDTGVSVNWFDLVFNNEVLVGDDSLSFYGIVDGSVLRSANIIATLDTLQDRQLAKLNLASLDRAYVSNPSTQYDIDLLPSQYIGNDSVPNDHPTGLIEGRPWIQAGPVPGAFTLSWYGTVSNPVATTGTYSTTNGGITLDPDSYIDVGAGLNAGAFTITLDAAPGLGWNGNRWDAIMGNEAFDFGIGLLCYFNTSTELLFGVPNQEVFATVADITDNVRRLYTFVYDETTMYIYENGSLVGSSDPSSYTTPNNNFYIGSRHDNGGGSGPTDSQGGTYYSLTVSDTALTAPQVLAAYNVWVSSL